MEMHQVRYFLAVARELNFTRAAEGCHVAQPSLTRAIKLLEAEFGGDLFRRERNLTHLTDLGHRMLPLMQQCYDSAVTAKQLASSIKTGAVAPLGIALSRTINLSLMVPALSELARVFPGLELQFMRGGADEIAEHLKQGAAEMAVASDLGQSWERLDSWPLFTEGFSVVVSKDHRLAGRNAVEAEQLNEERLLSRPYCEHFEPFTRLLKDRGAVFGSKHKMVSEHDLVQLLQAGMGIGILPASAPCPEGLRRVPLSGVELTRSVSLYAVSGRPRTPAATALAKLLRSADWTPRLH